MRLCLYAGRTYDFMVLEINNGGGETRYSAKVFFGTVSKTDRAAHGRRTQKISFASKGCHNSNNSAVIPVGC